MQPGNVRGAGQGRVPLPYSYSLYPRRGEANPVDEAIQQSMSKKWDSKPALDENGRYLLNGNGKTVLRKSYSGLQMIFSLPCEMPGMTMWSVVSAAEEYLMVTQFKVGKEQERLSVITGQTEQKEQQAVSIDKRIANIQKKQVSVQDIEKIEAKPGPLSSKIMLERSEYESLATTAKKYITQ